MNDSMYVFEVQASIPRPSHDKDGNLIGTYHPGYANFTTFVISSTLERALELVRAEQPEMKTHQVIRRNQSRHVIVDPDILR